MVLFVGRRSKVAGHSSDRRGHLVERVAQPANLIVARHRSRRVEVAFTHCDGGPGQFDASTALATP